MEIPQPEYRRGISPSLPSSLPLFPFPLGLGKTIRRPVGRSVFRSEEEEEEGNNDQRRIIIPSSSSSSADDPLSLSLRWLSSAGPPTEGTGPP